MHEKGLRLSGAWITGVLDLEGCRVPRDIGLLDCRFEATPVFLSAVIDTLAFDGSDLPGLDANRLEARGDLLFRSATVRGPIMLRGSRIGGDLNFDGATLEDPGGRVLSAERSSVRGGVLLRGAKVKGSLVLPGARIGGDLDLVGLTLEQARWRRVGNGFHPGGRRRGASPRSRNRRLVVGHREDRRRSRPDRRAGFARRVKWR